MTYTAEQLRRDAIAIERMHGETLTVEWRGHQASQLRAHADALEENARLRANRDFWHEACEQAQQHRDSANEQLAIADAEIAKLKDEQARAAKIVEGVEGSVGSGAAAMTYTAWDYRKLAEYHEQLGNAIIAKHYLAHADALEENARLTRECEFHAKQCARVDELRHRAEAELAETRRDLQFIERLANHHGQKPNITPREVLSMIQHYPPILEITRSYEDGKVPNTPNPWAELAKLRQMVAQQAEDEGLWFNAATAPEAYLQQELRKLHAAVEGMK